MRNISSDLSAKVRQSLQTLGNSGQPTLKIAASRAKTTITDASYWTTETIREGENLGDVSVAPRRLKSSGPPNRLYEIHVENGQVSTSLREYPDRLKEGWKPQFTLGSSNHPGSVAIAFDGYWERYRKLWRLITGEKPWIFWVDSTGVLWRQHWDDESTKAEMDTGVLRVRAIRGWKEAGKGLNDQGIVVGYVKMDGTVWYRNYCIQSDLTYLWEAQRQVEGFTGVGVNLNLFITNDYRLGIVVETNTRDIWWLITNRSWSGMAIPADHIVSGIHNSTFEVIPLNYINSFEEEHISSGIVGSWFNIAEPIYPLPLSILNPNKSPTEIRLKFNHILINDLTTIGNAFSFKDSFNKIFAVLSTGVGIDNSEVIFTLENFNSASGDMTVVYDRSVIELDSMNQGSIFVVEGFTLTFTPDLVPPEGYTKDYLKASFGTQFAVSQVYYNNSYELENLKAGIKNTSFVVTKVGSNPL